MENKCLPEGVRSFRALRHSSIGVAVLAGCSALPLSASAAVLGFKTATAPQAVALLSGVKIEPLITAGDVITNVLDKDAAAKPFQVSGVLDGMGFIRSSKWTVELFIDHELANKTRDPANATDNFDARISHFTLANNGSVLGAEYVLDGSEGFIWFCSGNLAVLDGRAWFFTGEEDQNYFSPHGGTTVAVNVHDTDDVRVLNHFGFIAHEQEMPIKDLKRAVFVLPEDNPGVLFPGTATPNISQLYSYTAKSWSDAIDGKGTLGVFVPDVPVVDGNPSTNDLPKGQVIAGHFEPLNQTTDNANQLALEQAAQAKGAFDFVRLEDVTQSLTDPRVVYFTDTGRNGRETVRGRVYKLVFDRRDPTRATLSVLLDGDAGDPIINPDNLSVSERALMIQEDRNSEHRFAAGIGSSLLKPGESPYSQIHAYDLRTGTLRTVARPDTLASLIAGRGEGDWETSGITNAKALWGEGWWLFTVQMHHTIVNQPDTATLAPNSTTGESGQVLRMYVPGT